MTKKSITETLAVRVAKAFRNSYNGFDAEDLEGLLRGVVSDMQKEVNERAWAIIGIEHRWGNVEFRRYSPIKEQLAEALAKPLEALVLETVSAFTLSPKEQKSLSRTAHEYFLEEVERRVRDQARDAAEEFARGLIQDEIERLHSASVGAASSEVPGEDGSDAPDR